MPKNKAINLLPQEEFNISTTGRILKWATGTFRIIVIMTEIVVMGAFLSRFWLDAQNSDLNNSIKVKSAQIAAQTDLENKFINTQLRVNIFGQLAATRNSYEKIQAITSKVPANMLLQNITISDTSAQVKGTSTSDIQIAQFIANLQNDKSLKKVEVEQMSSSEGNTLETVFILNILY